MPPRAAVRRPSTASALKKKPPREEKEEKEFVVGDMDRSERLELEDNDPQSDAEDDMGHYMGTEEECREQRIDGDDDLMGDMMEGEDEEEEDMGEDDVGGEHEEMMDGYEDEHHDLVKERRKRKEFEVFVGGLDRDVTEGDLFHFFRQVGDITEVRLMKNALTQKNKGFAFIRFATVEQARRAVNELKHPVINGKQCGVAPSQDSDTLFVGNICKTWTKAAVKDKLAYYGVDKYEDLTLVEDTKNEGMNRGFAFLDFSSRADALEACKRLQKRDVVFGTDRTARVAFADTFIEPDDEIMSQVRTIFLDGLPATWDEDRVRDYLKKFGRIEKIELARNMPAAKRTDFGFVTFDTHDSAVACVDSINNSELVDGERLVKVRARLSRPRQRGKSAKHARGGYLVAQGSGRGFKAPWGSSSSRMDSWKFTGRGGRSMQTRGAYDGGLKRPVGPRDRHSMMEMVPTRDGSRRRFPSPESSFGRRSPVYEKSSTKREYIQRDESFSRPAVFARDPTERRYYKDNYSSHRSEYLDSPPRNVSRAAGHRAPLYEDDDYDRYLERPTNYHDGHRHDYGSISSSKRSHSAMEEVHSRYAEPPIRHSRARFDYGGSNSGLPYDDHYGSESTSERRMGRGSRLGYDGGMRSSSGHSRGMYETRTSTTGYRRVLADDISRGNEEGMYSSYDREYMSRDYMPSRSDLGTGSYPSDYPSRRMNDGYLSGRGSGSGSYY
ncbi:nucleolin-like [Vitis riparia]|uniref:nucleolin-like n=1 Tax=Vitis riparia TaxID=96939 RepID=UPI00155A9311|nr:nucleolin-like [Vitis riparia]